MALDQAAVDGGRTAPRIVQVALAERSYDIKIGAGLIDNAGARIAAKLPRANCVIVTDENVARYHLKKLETSLVAAERHAGSIVLPAGEATKCFAELERLCGQLLDLELERGDAVVALGGGVIGDLAAFAGSILRRGVHVVQVPTTLLAQVDSAIGGKTGINAPQGKNLIGTFHQPDLVIADTQVLDTLDERQLRAGYAEVVKYGLIGDADFFGWLEDNWQGVLAGGEARERAIETSCKAKAAFVAADEREGGERALLNLGHTFGHALEAHAGYSSSLLHGEAVAIGMTLAFSLSRELDLCPAADAERVEAHLRSAGLPTAISDMTGKKPKADKLIALMAQDKKVKQAKPALILVRGIGHSFIEPGLDWQTLEAFLAREYDGQ